MMLLDTNVISEAMRQAPEARVVAWIDAQSLETLWLSAITVAELRAGVAQLPPGKRRTGLDEDLEQRVLPLFAGRILAFDLCCTQAYAQIKESLRKSGRSIGAADGFIAATAGAHGLAVVSRDVAPFQAAGLPVFDPWAA
jgi:predicted nucleic acid-binding protein